VLKGSAIIYNKGDKGTWDKGTWDKGIWDKGTWDKGTWDKKIGNEKSLLHHFASKMRNMQHLHHS
jgi:hypothetical protein